MKKLWILSTMILALTLSGCGEGGDGGGSNENSMPTANAGLDQNISTGSTVTLSGGGSDADGDLLTYIWSFSSKPLGSTAVLSDSTIVKPNFVAELDGAYILNLTVNDGNETSLIDSVTITASTNNSAPVANAGVAQSVVTGTLVTLDGSASSDANGDLLTYSWSFTFKPVGSSSSLSNSTIAAPTFTPDVAGSYVFNLIVNDGNVNSAIASVTIIAAVTNAAPVANAGVAQSVVITGGNSVTLDGSGSSDANGDLLTYNWAFTSKPAGSTSALFNATSAKPTFYPDVAGAYVFNLVVNDGKVNSDVATVTITVTFANEAPIANAGAAQTVVIGDTVTLDGNASFDPNGDLLTYSWELTSKPEESGSTISDSTNVSLLFNPDLPGIYTFMLTVSDSEFSSTNSVTITVLDAVSSNLTIYSPYMTISGQTLCNFQDEINFFGYIWNFNSCRIFGETGNKLTLTLRNNTNRYYILESAYLHTDNYIQNFNVYIELSPNSTYETDIALFYASEVTDAYAKIKITGLNERNAHFDINDLPFR